MILQLGTGLFLSTVLATVAFVRNTLSVSGLFGAIAIGTAIYAGGGLPWWTVLLTFFLTSTWLGRVGKARKAATKNEFSKGDRRDIWQALANGGVAALAALAYARSDGSGVWMGAFVGALATCNADTWATEVGILSKGDPWSIRTFRRVPRGTSGGISILGTLATIVGGAVIGLVAGAFAARFYLPPLPIRAMIVIGGVCGLAGSLVDSFLGATVQGMYTCPICITQTERTIHHCGATTH